MAGDTQANTPSFDEANQPPSAVFYIVSPDALQANLIKSCLNTSFAAAIRYHTALPLQTIMDKSADRRRLYLLDCLNAIDRGAIEMSLDVGQAKIPDHVMVVLYNTDRNHELARLVRRYHIRGIFYREDSQSLLITGMHKILKGNLWLRRKMLADCISISAETLNESSAGTLSVKEREVLVHVVAGESNQEIADSMCISLHTVKTHLYNTYKKINVPNRLQAALWAAAYLQFILID